MSNKKGFAILKMKWIYKNVVHDNVSFKEIKRD